MNRNDQINKQNSPAGRPTVTLLVLLVPQLLIAAFIMWRGADPDDYMLAIVPKQQLAASMHDQPNLLLVGGSSVAWGSDSETFTEICGLPCVNLAINAGQGLNFRFNEALKFSGPGDIVVLTLEYYELDPEPSGFVPTNTFAHVPSTLLLAGPREIRTVFDSGVFELLARRTRATANALLGKGTLSGLYIRQNFNDAGDFVGHHSRQPSDQKNWGVGVPPNTDFAFMKLEQFLNAARKKEVEVYYRLPCIPKSLVGDNMELLREIESELKSRFGERMLNEFDETLLASDCFFDTSYHLVEKEKLRVTRLLATRLNKLLKSQ